ncbi:MAG: prepilin-type N-terminal cleavage/methylation domain-containing protein [Pontiellaceae bacterium]|nr:prepilin-type N-terminal cleavage/methylation domain-containing protein [Pontiellaceae bacterium]MBN2783245.1 prepilin-type N-terminal cleavage/methylation domain-containing protein [Pontiellaceae bacterium]
MGGHNGFTLVEVMLAMVLFSILVIGGMMFVSRSGQIISEQRDKRATIAAANRRMELVRSVPYVTYVEEWGIGSDPVYLEYDRDTDSFFRSNSDPEEEIEINGRNHRIITLVRLVDTSSGNFTTAKCLEIEVRMAARIGGPENIVLKSYYSN